MGGTTAGDASGSKRAETCHSFDAIYCLFLFTTLINATGRLKCWKEGNEIMIGRGLSPHVHYLIKQWK